MRKQFRQQKHNGSSLAGFTLIELLFVITLAVVLTVGAAALFFTSLIGNSRKNVISTVKFEGDYAVSQMEFLLRNAIVLLPDPQNPGSNPCTSNMTSITLKSIDEGTTTLKLAANGQLASQSAAVGAQTKYLTSDAVTVVSPPGLVFNCTPSNGTSGSYVTIAFTLTKSAADYITATPVTQTFSTSVNIRSY